jgi:hypothetical protein
MADETQAKTMDYQRDEAARFQPGHPGRPKGHATRRRSPSRLFSKGKARR